MCLANLTETGLLAMVSLLIGFILSFCKTAEQSRCKNIKLCYGLLACERTPLTVDEMIELGEVPRIEKVEEEKTLN